MGLMDTIKQTTPYDLMLTGVFAGAVAATVGLSMHFNSTGIPSTPKENEATAVGQWCIVRSNRLSAARIHLRYVCPRLIRSRKRLRQSDPEG